MRKLLHPNQRGFVPGKSCEDNLIDLAEVIQMAKDKEQAYRYAFADDLVIVAEGEFQLQ